MELNPDKPRMPRYLHHLAEVAGQRPAADVESALFKTLQVMVVDLITMTMALDDLVSAVNAARQRTGLQSALLPAQAHRAAQI